MFWSYSAFIGPDVPGKYHIETFIKDPECGQILQCTALQTVITLSPKAFSHAPQALLNPNEWDLLSPLKWCHLKTVTSSSMTHSASPYHISQDEVLCGLHLHTLTTHPQEHNLHCNVTRWMQLSWFHQYCPHSSIIIPLFLVYYFLSATFNFLITRKADFWFKPISVIVTKLTFPCKAIR